MDLTTAIQIAHAAGRVAWPEIEVTVGSLTAMAAEAGVVPADLQTNGADFFLAVAAKEGNLKAIETIDRKFLSPVAWPLRRSGASASAKR